MLDVGCGTGRLLLDYLQQGIAIDGMDNSPEILAICGKKAEKLGLAPVLYGQYMESLDLPRRYQTILVPSSSFQLLVDPEKAREAMRRFFTHLEPGGVLVMPFMIEWQPGKPLDTGWKMTAEKVRPENGAVVRRRSRVLYDPVSQLERTEDVYEVSHGETVVFSEHHQRSPGVRWYTQDQASALYRDAGFADIQVYSGFSFQPAGSDDTLFTVVGARTQAGGAEDGKVALG